MAVVTLTEAKNHLRVTDTNEDSTIQIYLDAVDLNIISYLNRSALPVDNSGNIPAAIKAAALLMIGDLYEHRESQVIGQGVIENPAARNLLYPYRKEIGI